MDIAAYLDRIGFDGEAKADPSTLRALQRAHLRAIPYENLDVLLGRPVTTDPAAAFDKLVTRRRGGWCYEMNGVFGWALDCLGFRVTRLASGVMRSALGAASLGNHLVLRVDWPDGATLADVGLGDGPLEPFDVAAGPFTAGGLDFRLEALDDGWWRLHNHPGARPPDFDFHLNHGDEDLLALRCISLQTDPASIFVQNLICQRFTGNGHLQLLGRVLKRTGGLETSTHLLSSAGELTDVLADEFGLDEPAAADLWPRLCERHAELMGN